MSGRRAAPYEGLGKNKLEYVKVIPKFLQAHSAPAEPVKPDIEDNPDLEEKEEKEMIERVMKEQREEEEKRDEFYTEMGIKDTGVPKRKKVVEAIPEPDPEQELAEDDGLSMDENGRILFKRPSKHKLEKAKDSKNKKNKTTTSTTNSKSSSSSSSSSTSSKKDTNKDAPSSRNSTLLSFEDDE